MEWSRNERACESVSQEDSFWHRGKRNSERVYLIIMVDFYLVYNREKKTHILLFLETNY